MKLAENIKEITEELRFIKERKELSEELLETKELHDLSEGEKKGFKRLVRLLTALKFRSIPEHLKNKKLEEKKKEDK